MPKPPSAPPETELRVAATLLEVRRLTDCVRSFGLAHGLGEDTLVDLELAVGEAANNIVIHGYRGSAGEIALRIAQAGSDITVELADRGAAIPPDKLDALSAVDVHAESGRGLGIIRACVDTVAYASTDGVNRLTLSKRLG